MTVRRKSPQPEQWTRQDEENLTLEIAEDQRLLRLGINPDGNPVQIMLEVSRLAKSFNAEEK
jgi:hypothetical protein